MIQLKEGTFNMEQHLLAWIQYYFKIKYINCVQPKFTETSISVLSAVYFETQVLW